MRILLLSAAALAVLLGLAHSYLGERYILIRLFRRSSLPKLFGSDWFTRRTLRFAWHLTTVSFWGLAALMVLAAWSPTDADFRQGALLVVAGTFLVSAVVAFTATRGRHVSWIVFVAMAVLVLVAMSTSGCSPALERPETARDLAQEVRTANHAKITDALRRLQEDGGAGNFAIFDAGSAFVQFAGRKGWTSFYAEAHKVTGPLEEALTPEQIQRIIALGWGGQACGIAVESKLPSSDFCRTDWEAATEDELAEMAGVVLRTFTEGYGVSPEVPLEVEVVLE